MAPSKRCVISLAPFANSSFLLLGRASALQRDEGVVPRPASVRTNFARSHYEVLFSWDGPHVQHEVEVKWGRGCHRDHSAAVFTK